ncbi:Tellurium resistance [Streptomyces sp. NBC_00448]|uniref:Tellurium resistance n=1 Tax=Streptomyces sp. NBC_00448 TaxID=2903652 RepID=UPI002E235798
MTLRAGESVELPAGAVLRFRYEPGAGGDRGGTGAGGSGGPGGRSGGGPGVLGVLPPVRSGAPSSSPDRLDPTAPPSPGETGPGVTVADRGTILSVDLAILAEPGQTVRIVLRAPGRAPAAGRIRLLAVGVPGAEPAIGLADMECAAPTGTDADTGVRGDYVVGECCHYDDRWHFRALLCPADARPTAVTLTEDAPTASLTLQGATRGTLRATPAWQPAAPGTPVPAGIDLCALFELTDGSRGVVQALGGGHGALDRPPYLRLGTDRHHGDHVAFDLDHGAAFRRVLLFVSAHTGDHDLRGLNGSLILDSGHGAGIRVPLGPCTAPATACALALLVRDGPHLLVRREARYLAPRAGLSPQRMVDYAYGWGLRWTPGPG